MSMEERSQVEARREGRYVVDLSNQGLTYFYPSSALVRRDVDINKIRKLTLCDNTLSVVPNTISQFTSLEELDVSRNRISWISGELAHLSKLKIFVARSNQLRNLPKELESMQSLEILNLSGNLFGGIPREVFSLRSLKELYMGGNSISSIPDSIQQIKSLFVLYLGGNRLKRVPESLGSLANLQALILCDNQLEQIPREFAQLKKLKSLSLHKNKLKTLPMEIVMLMNLQELSLRENPLVNKFARDFDFNPPSLLELSGRAIKISNIKYSNNILPASLVNYLNTARRCVNPKCKGVYFDSRVRCLKFVDFCGQYRLPLEQYLCSPHLNCCDLKNNEPSVSVKRIQKLLLPQM